MTFLKYPAKKRGVHTITLQQEAAVLDILKRDATITEVSNLLWPGVKTGSNIYLLIAKIVINWVATDKLPLPESLSADIKQRLDAS